MEYQYWVVQDWNNSIAKQCGMSIGDYYESVVKHLPSTETSGENAFEPIQLNLKLSKDVCIPLSVAVTDNWYERLQQVVTDTFFRSQRDLVSDPKRVRFVDVTRKDIRGLTGDQLATCGKIRAFIGDQWLQVSAGKENIEPPTALRTDKQTQLVNWFDRKCKERLVQITSKLLSNCNQHDIVLKTKVDGPLDQEIRQILRESVPGGVSNVMETFGCTDKARQASGETAIARASETILRQIRQGLRANQAAVDRTISARIAASVASPSRVEQDDSEEPIFASLQNAPVHSAIEEQKLYTGIARKALGKGVINIVNHFYRGIGCGVCQTKKKEERVVQLEDGEDEAYYSDYYYGAVNKRFQDKYHAVAGRAIFMEPSAAAQQQQQLQGLRGARLRKKLQDLPPRPRLEPLGAPVKPLADQRPKLVPLGAPAKPKLVDDDDEPLVSFQQEPLGDKVGAQRPKVVPLGDQRPKLVPLGDNVDTQKPKLVPIGDSVKTQRPKLEPLDNDTPLVSFQESVGSEVTQRRPKLVPLGDKVDTQRPKLVPIGAPARPKLVDDDDEPLVSFQQEPLGDKVSVQRPKLVPLGDQRPKLVPLGASVKPKLVPLVAPEPRVDLTKGVQRVNDGLPDFLDFLKKNKK